MIIDPGIMAVQRFIRGWQVNPNLIFGDGETRLRPQMEVWFCAIAGTYAARHNALMGTGGLGQS